MLDHIMLRVKDYAESKRFYDEVLGTLGYRMVMEFEEGGGYGDTKPYFWIGAAGDPHPRLHMAFAAKDHAAVDAFHAKALALGAKDDGAPGLRPHYHASYYGAFVIDPNGHNIEAVCHTPANQLKKAASKKSARKASSARKAAPSKAAAKKKAAPASKRGGARKKSTPRRGR
ncbi:VOC family protein [Hyalangium versicolor]|uniref:VOC family protein n=1 Tax=Hyalangium versicolor TaxID=2861190 RepID=UPI001CCFF78F|nr:VOC family protein [Hyalangium versicolor]